MLGDEKPPQPDDNLRTQATRRPTKGFRLIVPVRITGPTRTPPTRSCTVIFHPRVQKSPGRRHTRRRAPRGARRPLGPTRKSVTLPDAFWKPPVAFNLMFNPEIPSLTGSGPEPAPEPDRSYIFDLTNMWLQHAVFNKRNSEQELVVASGLDKLDPRISCMRSG